MRLQVRVVELEDGVLRYGRDAKFSDDIAPVLKETLHRHTGRRWTVEELPDGAGRPSLVEVQQAEREAAAAATRAHPLVKAAFDAFPDAELIEDSGASPGVVRCHAKTCHPPIPALLPSWTVGIRLGSRGRMIGSGAAIITLGAYAHTAVPFYETARR